MASQGWSVVTNKKNNKNTKQNKPQNAHSSSKKKPLGTKDANAKGDDASPKKKPSTYAPTLKEAFAKMDYTKMTNSLEESKKMFPDEVAIWMCNVADSFNRQLIDVAMPKHADFNDIDIDYGMQFVTQELRKLICSELDECQNSNLIESFFLAMLDNITANNGEVYASTGYVIIAKILLRRYPNVTFSLLEVAHSQLIKNNFQMKPTAILTIFSIFGYAGVRDFGIGVKVWVNMMLPQLVKKHMSEFILNYIMKLMNHHQASQHKQYVSKKEFFPIYDLVYSGNIDSKLSPISHKFLSKNFPKIADVCFPDHLSSGYFLSYLVRLKASTSKEFKKKNCECLLKILCNDKNSYKVWESSIVKHLPESNILLEFIISKYNKEQFKDFLTSRFLNNCIDLFKWTDSIDHNMKVDIDKVMALLKTLKSKVASNRFPYFKMFSLLIIVALGLFVYDVKSSQGFEASKSNEILNMSGSKPFLKKYSAFAMDSVNDALIWSKKEIPVYYKIVKEKSGPKLKLAKQYSQTMFKSAMHYGNAYGTIALKYAHQFSNYVKEMSPILVEYFYDVCYAWKLAANDFYSYLNNLTDNRLTVSYISSTSIYYYNLAVPFVNKCIDDLVPIINNAYIAVLPYIKNAFETVEPFVINAYESLKPHLMFAWNSTEYYLTEVVAPSLTSAGQVVYSYFK